METYEEKFAYNINRLRNAYDLTQKQFAERIGYSEKTVSKWECVGSVPSIETLYKIATVFSVPLDELFRDKCTYFLGIDGGGTKTDFVLSDENLNIIKEVRLDGCNPIDIGIEKSKEILTRGIYEACSDVAISSVVMFAGLAGGVSGGTKEKLEEFFATFGFKDFENGSDTQNIVSAALGDGDGVIVIMGTGHCAIAQTDGEKERVSGWGYLLDDGGSGYSISRDALAAAYRSLDGSGEHTVFADKIFSRYDNPQELLKTVYDGGKRFIAAFCPLVFECAESGDKVCLDIIKKNMKFAANTIKTAAKKVGEKGIKAVAAGGLSSIPLAMQYLREELGNTDAVNLSVLDVRPVIGALVYAEKILKNSEEKNEVIN